MKIAVAGTGYVGLSLAVLLSQHNLHYLLDLMRRARQAILADEFEDFYQAYMASLAAADY